LKRGRPKPELRISEHDLQQINTLLLSAKTSPTMKRRLRVIVMSRQGFSNTEIAHQLGLSAPTVSKWRQRYIEEGLDGLYDRARPGRPRAIDELRLQRLLELCREPTGSSQRPLSCRTLSSATGITKSTVQRICKQLDLSPGGPPAGFPSWFETHSQILPVGLQASDRTAALLLLCRPHNAPSHGARCLAAEQGQAHQVEAQFVRLAPSPAEDEANPHALPLLQRAEAELGKNSRIPYAHLFFHTPHPEIILELIQNHHKLPRLQIHLQLHFQHWLGEVYQMLDHLATTHLAQQHPQLPDHLGRWLEKELPAATNSPQPQGIWLESASDQFIYYSS